MTKIFNPNVDTITEPKFNRGGKVRAARFSDIGQYELRINPETRNPKSDT